ncbi:MAG TPA: XrtA/PEP-CTERM system-associated ATPase [Burkholderiaceae bacterium]
MYEQHFGLTGSPFQLNPDPAFFYDSRGHSHALSYLKFGAHQGEGFIVVTGEIGAGKTTIVRTLLEELDTTQVVAAQIVSTQLAAGELLRAILIAFGVPMSGDSKAHLISTLEAFLTSLAVQGKRALLIVDEAQNLGRESIEELRMLSNFQIGTHSLLQSFLVGQPELRNLLKSKAMEQLRQRVTASCHLTPLDAEDTRKYIEHRLHHVSWAGNPEFSVAAYEKIHAWTAGVPRRINRLCNRLMLSAYLQERTGITEQLVIDTAAELRSEIGGLSDFAPVSAAATDELGGNLDLDLEIEPGDVPSDVDAPLDPAAPAPAPAPAATVPVWQPPVAPPPAIPTERTLLCVCDSASGFWKLASLAQGLAQSSTVPAPTIVHTGSERAVGEVVDAKLTSAYTAVHLALDPGDYGRVMAAATARFDALLEQQAPAAVLVNGTQNSTLACALLARKRGVPVLHLDAGRVHGPGTDATLNGALLDRLANECLTQDIADSNRLIREGKPSGNVHFMGSLAAKFIGIAFPHLRSADKILAEYDLPESLRGRYGVLAWRFPTIPDPQHVVAQVATVLRHVAQDIPLVWPLRSAERRAVIVSGCDHLLEQAGVIIVRDRGYVDMLALLRHARCLASGAEGHLLEEAGALGITTLTVGPEAGDDDEQAGRCDVAVGLDAQLAQRAVRVVNANDNRLDDKASGPDVWDGGATARVTKWLAHWLGYKYRTSRKGMETIG